ncbi:MAG: sulfate transporter CysZ [Gammaproteobacteria bacterium]|nr:sulfate transporter CysZ [Gammaproteobacteria bacterium]MDH3768620.1 sulfate transporter CysZ [Gammaproteobacteria bacterium]
MPATLLKGASYAFAGLRHLGDRNLRLFVLGPLLLNLGLFSVAIWWVANAFDGWMSWLVTWLPDWLDWLEWLIWPIFALAVILVMFYSFTMIANIIGAPLNGLLAEKVEQLRRPQSKLPQGRPFWREVPYAVAHEFRKWAYIVPRALPVLVLFLLPGLNALAPFIWFGFGAWMLTLEYADYPMGNHGLTFKKQRDLLREQRVMALGFGAAVMLMTLVPLLNFLSMPSAVIGATLMWAEQFAPAENTT